MLTLEDMRLLELVLKSRSYADIARMLGWNRHTLRLRMRVLREKLGARNRVHLARLAFERGWRPHDSLA